MNEESETETGLHRAITRRWPETAWLVPFLRYLTPTLVGAAIATIIGGLVYVFNSPQKDINRVEQDIHRVEQSMEKQGQRLDEAIDLLHKNESDQSGMKSQLNDLAEESRSARKWRDDLARIAAERRKR